MGTLTRRKQFKPPGSTYRVRRLLMPFYSDEWAIPMSLYETLEFRFPKARISRSRKIIYIDNSYWLFVRDRLEFCGYKIEIVDVPVTQKILDLWRKLPTLADIYYTED